MASSKKAFAEILRRHCFVATLTLVGGCTPRAAQFDTVTNVEAEEASDPSSPHPAAPVTLSHSSTSLERTTRMFVLALESRASDDLRKLLSHDAIVRPNGSAAQLPALSTLEGLAAELPVKGTLQARSGGNRSWLGRVEIVEIQSRTPPARALLHVHGPKKLQGSWTLVFTTGSESPLIREIIVPKTR